MFSTIIEIFYVDFVSMYFYRFKMGHLSKICIALFSAGLNLSLTEPRPQPPDNRTIQAFVKDYIDEYVSEYTIKGHMSVIFELIDL